MPPGPERTALEARADRFERDLIASEHAALSKSAYAPGTAPPGWKNISDDPKLLAKYGLNPKDLYIEGSNFRAQVYLPDPAVFGTDMKPVVAFKGTNMTNLEDWQNNGAQGLNLYSSYYEAAVNIGKKLEESGADVAITGHSLGGGLASAAARASGLPADTFNAAGLHDKTVERYGGTVHVPVKENIHAYRVEGEVLTGAQEQKPGATGMARMIPGVWGGSLSPSKSVLLRPCRMR